MVVVSWQRNIRFSYLSPFSSSISIWISITISVYGKASPMACEYFLSSSENFLLLTFEQRIYNCKQNRFLLFAKRSTNDFDCIRTPHQTLLLFQGICTPLFFRSAVHRIHSNVRTNQTILLVWTVKLNNIRDNLRKQNPNKFRLEFTFNH